MLSTLGILKVIALKGFPFTEVPLSEQPLTCSPSRAGCSGFVWKAPCFPAALTPQLSPRLAPAACPHRSPAAAGNWAGTRSCAAPREPAVFVQAAGAQHIGCYSFG